MNVQVQRARDYVTYIMQQRRGTVTIDVTQRRDDMTVVDVR